MFRVRHLQLVRMALCALVLRDMSIGSTNQAFPLKIDVLPGSYLPNCGLRDRVIRTVLACHQNQTLCPPSKKKKTSD
jgi:hypothetical protein